VNVRGARPVQRWRLFGGVLAGLVALAGILSLPVTTRQGVNYDVTTYRLPLYLTALEFVDRSAQYRQIAAEITRGATSDEARALKVFEWTRRQIRTTPQGWPVVDDHILNIIIRGHGTGDQQADVFATLATYAGVPAFWRCVPPDHQRPGIILSFARVAGRWRVFDVAAGIAFRTPAGDLATLDELSGHAELVPVAVRLLEIEDVPYADIVTRAPMPVVPHPLRAELQMPLPRVWHEMKAAVGFEPADESER
jgi:hypothetical protein